MQYTPRAQVVKPTTCNSVADLDSTKQPEARTLKHARRPHQLISVSARTKDVGSKGWMRSPKKLDTVTVNWKQVKAEHYQHGNRVVVYSMRWTE